MRGGDHEQVRILKGEVYDLMVKEDCLWHQRSKVDWLKSGDMNTTYFHSQATQRDEITSQSWRGMMVQGLRKNI